MPPRNHMRRPVQPERVIRQVVGMHADDVEHGTLLRAMPPGVRTISTAQMPNSFSPGRGFEKCDSLPHDLHGGCATIGHPPGQVSASRSMS